ncbi:MAG: PID-CTERM protein-sorting domain-containing protein [Cyclobacteriaceae bacterium]
MIKKGFVVLVFLISFTLASGQPSGCTEETDPCNDICLELSCGSVECKSCLDGDNDTIPLDGGLIWLVLGGAGLGVRSLLKKKKKN